MGKWNKWQTWKLFPCVESVSVCPENLSSLWFRAIFHILNLILAKVVLQLSSMIYVVKDSSLPLYAGTGNPSWILNECSHRRHWCNCYHPCSNSRGKQSHSYPCLYWRNDTSDIYVWHINNFFFFLDCILFSLNSRFIAHKSFFLLFFLVPVEMAREWILLFPV